MSKYMMVLVFAGAVPFLLSFFPPLKIYRNAKALFFTISLILLLFGSWDVFAVRRSHWYFDTYGVWDFRIINLPLEEVLFFVVIPFCCIFTWEATLYIKSKIK